MYFFYIRSGNLVSKTFILRLPTILKALIFLFSVLVASCSHSSYPKIPDTLTFLRADGVKQVFSSFKGKQLVVIFWSPSCVICMQEVPELNQLYLSRDGGGSRFDLLAVSMSYDRPDSVIEAYKNAKMAYPVYLDLNNNIASAFGNITVTPTLFIIDSNGKVTYQSQGKQDIPDIVDKLNILAG